MLGTVFCTSWPKWPNAIARGSPLNTTESTTTASSVSKITWVAVFSCFVIDLTRQLYENSTLRSVQRASRTRASLCMPPSIVQTPLASACQIRERSAGAVWGMPPTYVAYLPNSCCNRGSENCFARPFSRVDTGRILPMTLGRFMTASIIAGRLGLAFCMTGSSKQSNNTEVSE